MPPKLRYPGHTPRRAAVIGAGSFGTAVAILLERAGVPTTLVCRTHEQATRLNADGHNGHYLPGVGLPAGLKVRALDDQDDQFRRSDLVFIAVPSKGMGAALQQISRLGVADSAGIVSLAKGLVHPEGTPPTVALERAFGPQRTACVAGPAHAREMVESGAGVVCEVSDDPVGAELAGVAKNAAAVAVGATQAQGLNAAGMAAADIFLEVLALAERSGGKARTFVGRSGTGDLVATALAPSSRNRSAGELLAGGVPGFEIPARLGQAVEALETVPLLAAALKRAGLEAPVISALGRLIDGSLPVDDWVRLVRAKQPAPARFGPPRTWWGGVKAWFSRAWHRKGRERPQLASGDD
jgi:glycerol-3-phosphate dehydrogenase (NAD(P)+)